LFDVHVADSRLAVGDEHGTGATHLSGEAVLLPVTDDPMISGADASGHSFRLLPGINMNAQTVRLARTHGPVEVTTAGLMLEYMWQVVPLTIHVQDQFGQTIPGSVWGSSGVGSLIPTGTTFAVPVSEDPMQPPIFGQFADGYDAGIFPGIAGSLQVTYLSRSVQIEVIPGGTVFILPWTVVQCPIRIVNEMGMEVVDSEFSLSSTTSRPAPRWRY
jgi:hypothetical protein